LNGLKAQSRSAADTVSSLPQIVFLTSGTGNSHLNLPFDKISISHKIYYVIYSFTLFYLCLTPSSDFLWSAFGVLFGNAPGALNGYSIGSKYRHVGRFTNVQALAKIKDGVIKMDAINFQVVAGMLSTAIFTISNIPMLVKAARTHDLKSYSRIHIVLGNIGNLIHWVYIFHLPFGPIWFLHSFYTISSIFMLLWHFRYEGGPLISHRYDLHLVEKIRRLSLRLIPWLVDSARGKRLSATRHNCLAVRC
jgi:hypothetical protein